MAYSVSSGPKQGHKNPAAAGATSDQKNSRNHKKPMAATTTTKVHSPKAAQSRKKSKKPF
jgi:hypothetical protein